MYSVSYSHKGNVDVEDNKVIVEIQSIDYQNRKSPVGRHDLLIDTGVFITMMNKKTANRRGYPIVDVKGCAISGFSQQGLLCDLRKTFVSEKPKYKSGEISLFTETSLDELLA